MELVGIPDPETFCQLPWDKRVARVFCTCYRNREERENPGAALTSDCRGNLKRFHREFQDKYKMDFRVGTEPEMMWLKRGEDGKPDGGFSNPYCYHIDQFESLRVITSYSIHYTKLYDGPIIKPVGMATSSSSSRMSTPDRAKMSAFSISMDVS